MIPYGKQYVDKKDVKAVAKTVYSDFLTQGPKIIEFEHALTKYTGAKYAVVVSNGTAALHLAYVAAGFKPGSEVITTPNTFVATTNMMIMAGLKPVFCDINLDTYNIDESKIAKLITPKTKAIVPVHFAGRSCDMSKIIKLAKNHKLLIIEDACHALGTSYEGKLIGNIGDMTVFSFHSVKTITTGEGGAILTNSEFFYKKLLYLRSHGIYKDTNGFNVMTEMGWNYRMTDIQASLGISQLNKINIFLKKRRGIIDQYKKYLGKIKEIILPNMDNSELSAWHIFVIRVKNPKDRLPLYNYLKKSGIGVNFHYPPVYSHPFYKKIGFSNPGCRNADKYAKTAITVPLHPFLSIVEVKFICSKISSFFEERK